ncbi:Uncharacterised protein [Klebsiella oxytoca]|nr:hypothetical protein AI2918V1_4215 [Klebsiella oxytoca]CAH5653458.1 hypothetical protein AI2991V1_2912 [Klebsiella oxytoca]CAH5912423.1 hypothetical protein AI2918V1_4215 [Klebsiella oxytoca]SAQ42038.1 Uncharacterised protein [Klebsiella oxytoca]SAQ47654.1 Uncharacterised protein [Klebsiella oxytoca]
MLRKVNNFKVLVFFSLFGMSISQWWQFVFFREDSRKCLLGIESIFIGYTHHWLISLDEIFSCKFKFFISYIFSKADFSHLHKNPLKMPLGVSCPRSNIFYLQRFM